MFIINLTPEQLARKFHENYERLAVKHGYETRKDSAVAWQDVPANNKALMIDVCGHILEEIKKNTRAMTLTEALSECQRWRMTDEECEELEK